MSFLYCSLEFCKQITVSCLLEINVESDLVSLNVSDMTSMCVATCHSPNFSAVLRLSLSASVYLDHSS